MLAEAHTFALIGIDAHHVRAEVDVSNGGLPAFSLVGLPDAAVRESRERVRSALLNSGFKFPNDRITANLAPANLRKAGPAYDLAIAAALLAASRQLPPEAVGALERTALAGELALDGSVRRVPGVLPMAERARIYGIERLVVPAEVASEAALANLGLGGGNGASGRPPLRVVPVECVEQLRKLGTEDEPPPAPPPSLPELGTGANDLADLSELQGQSALRRALEIAAAGGHSLAVEGPPGAGKTMAAIRLPSILPPLSARESVEAMRVQSAAGQEPTLSQARRRPFRSPHHTISTVGLVGGGNPPRPGEVTLAHRGVLFLDEFGEFSRGALEALRQPLEDGRVTIVRAGYAIELPCRFMLVAAANPCPCGVGVDSDRCKCSPLQARRYRARLSGALADRVDISVRIEQPEESELGRSEPGESSAAVLERVGAARERQADRLGDGRTNAEMTPSETRAHARLESEAALALNQRQATAQLSGRGHERVLRLARTIADLEGRQEIVADDVEEACTHRQRQGDDV
jgi:magnesium chelatase family protein